VCALADEVNGFRIGGFWKLNKTFDRSNRKSGSVETNASSRDANNRAVLGMYRGDRVA
jgi:hypothetical protein